MRTAFFISILLLSSPAFADWDYRVGFDVGSLSYWTNAAASLGYGIVLWGEDPLKEVPDEGFARPDQYPWRFGYLRPEIKIESSTYRNAVSMDLELSPISWIIFDVGRTSEHRSENGRLEYDCANASCYGGLERHRFTFGGFPVAIGPFFIVGFMRREWIESQGSGNRDFVDQMTGLVGKTANDRLQTDAILGGFVLSDKWVLGGGHLDDSFEKSGEESSTTFGTVSYYEGKTSITLTAGERSRSSQKDGEYWGHISLRWIGKRGLWP